MPREQTQPGRTMQRESTRHGQTMPIAQQVPGLIPLPGRIQRGQTLPELKVPCDPIRHERPRQPMRMRLEPTKPPAPTSRGQITPASSRHQPDNGGRRLQDNSGRPRPHANNSVNLRLGSSNDSRLQDNSNVKPRQGSNRGKQRRVNNVNLHPREMVEEAETIRRKAAVRSANLL